MDSFRSLWREITLSMKVLAVSSTLLVLSGISRLFGIGTFNPLRNFAFAAFGYAVLALLLRKQRSQL